jgi:hypothetical protein
MNWLIQEKMSASFYNKFRPLIRMHNIRCVSSSLLTQSWLLQVCGTFDHCFITTHSIDKEGDYRFTLVWYSLKQGTTHRPMSHLAHLHTVPFLWPWEGHRWQHSWVDFACQCLLWRLLSRKTIFALTLGHPTNLGVGRSWLFPASTIIFLTRRSMKSQWVYLAPHKNNNIHLLSIANSYNGLPNLFSSVWLAHFQKPVATDMNVFYSDKKNRSKATMWLLHKIPAIQGCPRCF